MCTTNNAWFFTWQQDQSKYFAPTFKPLFDRFFFPFRMLSCFEDCAIYNASIWASFQWCCKCCIWHNALHQLPPLPPMVIWRLMSLMTYVCCHHGSSFFFSWCGCYKFESPQLIGFALVLIQVTSIDCLPRFKSMKPWIHLVVVLGVVLFWIVLLLELALHK